MNYQDKADALFEDQKSTWPILGDNWKKLGAARLKRFDFEGYSVQVQFNPKRIISSSAKVDKASIEKRKCFLCINNRPPEEKSVWFEEDYEILCNPFPIFEKHFTITKTGHTPQLIEPEFGAFLELSKELPNMVVFYNAPACGASAPDHMHFQAGSREFMPIENDIKIIKQNYGKSILQTSDLSLMAIDDGLRRFMVLESMDSGLISTVFSHIYHFVKEVQNGSEPMLNILSYYRRGWQVLIFPRDKHRPRQYFEEGDSNILLSPAAVDMGGMLITPLEKDFNKISREDIRDIFSQITFSKSHFTELSVYLGTKLQNDV